MKAFFFTITLYCIVGDVVFTIPYMCKRTSQVNTSCLSKTPLCQVLQILISSIQAKLQLHKTLSIPLTFSCCHLSQFTPSTNIPKQLHHKDSMTWGSWKFYWFQFHYVLLGSYRDTECTVCTSTVSSQYGRTPLSIARSKGHERIVQLLLEASRQR